MGQSQWMSVFSVVSIHAALSACSGEVLDAPPVHPAPADERALPRGLNTPQDDAVPAPLLEKVLADAAQRTQMPLSKLEITSTEKITWNDGSLGCPRPDRMYTEALVPGYRIRVRSAGQTLDYHAAEAGQFLLCSLPQPGVDDHEIR